MFSFFRHLRRYLEAVGIEHTQHLDDDYDILLIASWSLPYERVLRAKRRSARLRVMHRIDGAARDYGRDGAADRRTALVNQLADVTVFQSAYGKFVTREKYRIVAGEGPVIHNPVDTDLFSPDGARVALPGRIKVVNVSYSTNPMKGAPALFEIARAEPDVDFFLVGPHERAPSLPNLHVLGYIDWERLPALLRSCDVFLTLSRNEACPNVVLEALASGLPVLYHASGGTPELVGDCGEAIEPATFRGALTRAVDARPALSAAARRRVLDRFAPSVIFPRYLDAAARAERRPIPDPLARAAARVQWAFR